MNKNLHAFATMALVILTPSPAAWAQTAPDGSAPTPSVRPTGKRWWEDGGPRVRPFTNENKRLPLITVRGNRFVDPDGAPVLFRGLSISDPDKIEGQGHWNRNHFVKVREMGATVVRIPVHPVAWRERTPAGYIKLLDQAVGWCTELGMYVIIDWHTIGNLETGLYQNPMYETTKPETYNFWRTMARHFATHNTVAFFELFNEPTTYRNQLGPVSWSAWKKSVEEQIAIIRAHHAQAIPLVAGFDWAYDLTPLLLEPIAAEGIGYTTHPYANKRKQPWAPRWDEDFGFAAEKYPIFATEFGGFKSTEVDGTTDTAYGPAIINYLEGKGISWAVWCFDPQWGPTLIRNWDYELTPSGEFAKAAMHGSFEGRNPALAPPK